MPEKQTVEKAQRAKFQTQRGAMPNETTRRVTKRNRRRLAAVPKRVNGRSNAKIIALHRPKRYKNRRALPPEDGHAPPAQRLPDAQHAPRAAVDVRWPLAKRLAPARDESKSEV